MNESSQAIVAVKREVQLSEWQRQVQERQEQGIPVDGAAASALQSKNIRSLPRNCPFYRNFLTEPTGVLRC